MVIPKYVPISRKNGLLFIVASKEEQIKAHNNSILELEKEVRVLKYKLILEK